MRFILACAAALLLAGCANSSIGLSGDKAARPKTIVVTDFVFAPDVVAIDRSFTARLERKIGAFPTYERKQRTNERVNDEIVASIIATLREAGLEAQPGSEDGLSLKDDVVVVSGTLRAADPAAAKKNLVGFGAGRGGVIAAMTLGSFSSFGKKQLLSFAVDQPGGRKPGGKTSPATNAAIAEALAAEKAASEKLSPDVEAVARSLGRAVGEKIVAYAREQSWLQNAAAAAPPPDDKPARLPARKPNKKSDKPAV